MLDAKRVQVGSVVVQHPSFVSAAADLTVAERIVEIIERDIGELFCGGADRASRLCQGLHDRGPVGGTFELIYLRNAVGPLDALLRVK